MRLPLIQVNLVREVRKSAAAIVYTSFGVLILAATGSPVLARETPPKPSADNPVERRISEMRDHLKLNDEQVGKIRELFRENGPKLREIRDDKSLSDAEKRERFQAILKSTTEKVGPLLTPEQKTAYLAMRGPGDGPGGGPRNAPDGPPFLKMETLKERLKLSEAQADKIAPVLKEEGEKLRSLRGEPEGEKRREKGREILTKLRERISAELNEEQKQQLRDWLNQHRPPDQSRK